ncbi:Hok/Gef family protein [Erwinia sp. E602]|uniref:Hok/Gef family protein n=1 Tax=Erwinia sp. E602 TaxID=2675378 RepID=UPI001BACA979|nr:Hok/Gef family protein [Erwinia sp. E602]QUG76040.1 Hok/Gef family protein [Erwinia sp. E602]
MRQHAAIPIAILIIIIITVVVVLNRKDLCELRIRSGQTEVVAVFMAYESIR